MQASRHPGAQSQGDILNGISGQGIKVCRVQRGLRFHRQGSAILPGETVHERTKAVQELQVQNQARFGN
jgi:hypothetical protein